VPPKLLTAHDACYLLLNNDCCLGCLQWVEPAVHACISEAAFASRKREAGSGVFYLLFLLAYAFTVPITFLTRVTRRSGCTLQCLGGHHGRRAAQSICWFRKALHTVHTPGAQSMTGGPAMTVMASLAGPLAHVAEHQEVWAGPSWSSYQQCIEGAQLAFTWCPGSVFFLLVTRGGVTLLAGHTHQPDESDCGGLQHCCH
jgi:hypothetical protein